MYNTISNRQIFFILVLTLTSYSVIVIPKVMAESAGTGAWFTIAVGALILSLAAMLITILNNRFHGMMLFDYSSQLVTKLGAYILSTYYIFYFLLLLVFMVSEEAQILQSDFFPKTPLWAFPLASLPVFCYIAYKGITTIARLCEILGIVFIVTAALVHLIMFTQGKINRILPLFNIREMVNYLISLRYVIFPFAPMSVLLVIPFTPQNGKKSIRTAFFSILFIGIFYIMVVESSIMKVGLNDIVHYKDSLIVAIRDTSPEKLEILARLDILYLTVGFAGLFIGASVILTGAVELLCRIFTKMKRGHIVALMGAIAYLLFLVVSPIKGFEGIVNEVVVYLALIAKILIPSILLIIATIKKEGFRRSHG